MLKSTKHVGSSWTQAKITPFGWILEVVENGQWDSRQNTKSLNHYREAGILPHRQIMVSHYVICTSMF